MGAALRCERRGAHLQNKSSVSATLRAGATPATRHLRRKPTQQAQTAQVLPLQNILRFLESQTSTASIINHTQDQATTKLMNASATFRFLGDTGRNWGKRSVCKLNAMAWFQALQDLKKPLASLSSDRSSSAGRGACTQSRSRLGRTGLSGRFSRWKTLLGVA